MTFVSAKKKPNPLDIPEVVSLVASFVTVWDKTRFKPRDILSCAQVNKLWRQAMVPHLWAVYSPDPMVKFPVDVIVQNSIHFRHLDSVSADRSHKAPLQLWYDNPATGQPRLLCTGLRTIVLSPPALESQLSLVHANRTIVSLKWFWGAPTLKERAIISSAIEPCSLSLKQLHLYGGQISSEDLIFLLNMFPRLELITLATQRESRRFTNELTETTGSTGRNNTLKQLTIHDDSLYGGMLSTLLNSVFRHCLMVEHVVVHRLEHEFYAITHLHQPCESFLDCWDHFLALQLTVLAWKTRQHLENNPSAHAGDSVDKKGVSPIPMSKLVSRDVEILDMYHDRGHPIVPCHVRFQRGYQDLVVLKTCIRQADPHAVMNVLKASRHSLRELDLQCESILDGYTLVEVFGHILGLLTELQSLKLRTQRDMSEKESLVVFKGEFELEGRGGSAGWACQRLESLTLLGLWLTDDCDRPGKDHDAVTLEAASKDHRWVAKSPVRVDEQFQAVISGRIKTLPALRELNLGKTSFACTRILSPPS